jgi:hypothetical protein
MKRNLIIFLVFFFITFLYINGFSQKPMLVTKDNFSALGWGEAQINRTSGSPDVRRITTDFVNITCGPDNPRNPPLNPGSAHLTFPKTNDPTLYRVILNNNIYEGTNVGDIKELKYSTYTVATPANTPGASGIAVDTPVAPILLLQIDMDGDGPGTIINNINFFPFLQDPATMGGGAHPVKPGKWQEWDALIGLWKFFKRNSADPDPDLPVLFTLSAFVKEYKDAKIVNTDFNKPNGGPGIRFLLIDAPNYVDFNGYIDAFKIKTPPGTIVKPGSQSGHLNYDFKAEGDCSN